MVEEASSETGYEARSGRVLSKHAGYLNHTTVCALLATSTGVTGAIFSIRLREDLLADGPLLCFVSGAAGMGKSVLFEHLLLEMYQRFQAAKRQHTEDVPRPVPFLPMPIWKARRAGQNVDGMKSLVAAIRNTPGAAPTNREALFEWLLTSGHTFWLFDGLDEFYAGDPGFMQFLLERAGAKSRTKILVFMRDSLLATSQRLTEQLAGLLLEPDSTLLRLYRLSAWGPEERRHYAWLRLEGRAPGPGPDDPPRVAKFLADSSLSTISNICRLPYYCKLLVDQVELQRPLPSSEFALLGLSLGALIDREEEKLVPRSDVFRNWSLLRGRAGLEAVLENIAWLFCADQHRASELGNRYKGLSQQDLAEQIIDEVFAPGTTPSEMEGGRLALGPVPAIFRRRRQGTRGFRAGHHGGVSGRTLGGASGEARSDPPRPGGWSVLLDPESLYCRFIDSELADSQGLLGRLLDLLRQENVPFFYRRNLLQVIAKAIGDRSFLKKDRTLLTERNLAGFHFTNLDMRGACLRDADLTHAIFDSCDLAGADFEGTRLCETVFTMSTTLRRATFGGLERFISARRDDRLIISRQEMSAWLRAQRALVQ